MAAIEAVVFIATAGFAFVIVITVIVITGVRQEERYKTLENRTAPSAMAQLARIVLGRYVRAESGDTADPDYLEDRSGSRDRRVGPRS